MSQSECSNDCCQESVDNATTNDTVLDQGDDKENSHETEDQERPTAVQNTSKRLTWNMVLREILFFVALALTTYDALQNSPPKISRTPTAMPFFEKGSLVTDWYKGQLSSALSQISTSEISFVMYYAPWDAESQHVRHEFDKAAQTMFKQVYFSAVNCWHPGGECRLHHNKISVWPIIMAYTTHLKSVLYTGPKDSASMVRFLRHVTKPLRRLTSTDDLVKLLTVCDAVTVGFTPLSDKPIYYNAFYSAALKSLELDPFADVCFTVVTSEQLAGEMGVELLPNIRLMLWNETLEYPADSPFSEEGILGWVWSHVNKKTAWYTPQWQKSFNMQKIFTMGPVLILFTPRNHYYEQTPNYNLLHEVALEYNNCENPWITEITKLSALQRRGYIEYERNMTLMCIETKLDIFPQENIPKKSNPQPPVSKASKKKWLNKTICKNDLTERTLQSFWFRDQSNVYSDIGSGSIEVVELPGCCKKDEGFSYQTDRPIVENSNEELFDAALKELISTQSPKSVRTSMLTPDEDPRSPINLNKRRLREVCILLGLAQKFYHQVYPELDNSVLNIEGLSCKTNRTLFFFAIDSLNNHHFAESLGIDILNVEDNTAAVILDNERETQYVLQKPFGEQSLREFVYNFTMNLLSRDLRTVPVHTKYTHYFGSDKIKELAQQRIESTNFKKSVNPWCQTVKANGEIVCINELNTSNFYEFIMQKNKAVLLALCGGGSGPCGGLVSLVLLAVARLFCPGHLAVGRIDPTKHDLPWQYTVSKYPTLVFFPMTRKDESRSYPEKQPITVEGVLAFVLAGMEPPLKLHAQVLLCNQTQGIENMKECLKNVRVETLSLIGRTLKQWRRFRDTSIRSLLLKRLQCLRSVAISLGALNTTKLPSDNHIIGSFKNSINSLIQMWNMNINASNIWTFGNANKSVNFRELL